MSKAEAQVLISNLQNIIQDLRDLDPNNAPQHVIEDRARNIETLQEAAKALATTFGVSI